MRLMFGSTPRCGKSIGLYWNEIKMSEKYTYRGSTVYEHGEELSTIDIVDLLNEQQATINKLKKARDESDKFITQKGLGAEFLNWCVENE